MSDEFTLTLNSPITEEQWDMITDVDLDNTNEITFHTKHGKEVKFVKASAQPDVPDINVGNCPYCHEDSDGFVFPIEKNGHAYVWHDVDGWAISLRANGWHGSAKIRYCPMCGRDLLVK